MCDKKEYIIRRRTTTILIKSAKYNTYADRCRTTSKLYSVVYECNPEILNDILWTDECKFLNNGVIKQRNSHFWSRDNRHCFKEYIIFKKFAINVWCELIHGHLIRPHFYEQNLTAARYSFFVMNLESYYKWF